MKKYAKLLAGNEDLKRQREKFRRRLSRNQDLLEKAKDDLAEAYVMVQDTAKLALEQTNLLVEKGCELELLKDRMSLKSYNLKTMMEPCDLQQLADVQDVNFEDQLAVDKDDSFAMRYYLALFKCIQSGASSRTQVYSFLNCLRGALPPRLNSSSFKKFLDRFEIL